jgi:phosphatidylglycerophosphate synthase
MSKLPSEHKFLDLSDYGRSPARWIANVFKETRVTAIHLTSMFIIAGILAIFMMLNKQLYAAAILLIIKSILDAADGELARLKQKPSYVGRYFDSVSDIILNFFFLATICYITNGSWALAFIAFLAMQLQGTLYNYYYVIFRNRFNGDKTSRIFEDKAPSAMTGEKQSSVNKWFWMYKICYSIFDKTIYQMDRDAKYAEHLPKWFMTAISAFGLGFQLLIISFMLCVGLEKYIILFFIFYSILIFVFILFRKGINSGWIGNYVEKR